MLPKKAAGVVLGGRKRTWAENVIYIAFYAVIFFVSVAYLVDATYNPFYILDFNDVYRIVRVRSTETIRRHLVH